MTVLEYSPWSAPILAAALSAATLALLLRSPGRLPQDYPTERSLHRRPVSRVGGIAIWAGFLPVALLSPAPLGAGRAWLVCRGRSSPPCHLRTTGGACGQRFASRSMRWRRWRSPTTLPWPGDAEGSSLPHILATAGAVLAIVWSANLFNFMDGNDGLAALMSICGFGAYGVAAARTGMNADALFALASATLVFLRRQPAAGEDVHGRRRFGRPRISRRRLRLWRHSHGNVAGVVSRARFPAVRGRCHRDGVATDRARRSPFRSAPNALLSKAAPDGVGTSRHASVLRHPDRRHVGLGVVHAGSRARCGVAGARRVDSQRSACSSPALIIFGAGVNQNNNEATPQLPGVACLCPRPLRRGARLGRDLLVAGSASTSTSPFSPTWRARSSGSCRLQAAIFVAFGLYRGLWRFASVLDLQRIVLAAGLGALLIPVGARDAADAGGRAAQRADLLPDRAHFPDGRRSLRLPDLEGASALQPASPRWANRCS